MKKTTLLKKMLNEKRAVVAIGVHDALSAILAERAGFELIQCSGFGLAGSVLGKPDVGLFTLTEMVEHTRNIVNAVNIPVMGDGDTGFGNAVNVVRTIQEFENAGCAGINLEDQVFPKRCGHMEGKQIISTEEMILKIKAAVYARKDTDFVINARTDAIAIEGIDKAIARANAYAGAGADLIFMEAPRSIEDIKRTIKEVKAPVSVNLFDSIKGGKTPLISVKELKKMGVGRVSIPVGSIFASAKGIMNYFKALKDSEDMLAEGRFDLVTTFEEFKEIVGLHKIKELENQFLPKDVIKEKYSN